MSAIQNGHIEIIKLLLDNKADVNIQRLDGTTALMDAVYRGKGDIAKLLIENGANVNACTKDGCTVLAIATLKGRKDILLLLIENGAKASETFLPLDELDWATSKDCIEILIKKGMPIPNIPLKLLDDCTIWLCIEFCLGKKMPKDKTKLENKEDIFNMLKSFFRTHYRELPEQYRDKIMPCCSRCLTKKQVSALKTSAKL
jgi:predicted RNA-binding protein YlqC (UPF0109 family)